jgi:membrane-bound lytic murein transglycosylase B
MKKILALLFFAVSFPAHAATGSFDFDRWNTILNDIQERAVAEKIDDRVINAAIQDAAFIPKIVWRDRNQSEFKLSLGEYLERMVSKKRIADGRRMRGKYPTLLRRARQKYGVPESVLLAFWGLESNYGDYKAGYRLSDAFLTLIYEGRRERFFAGQLLALMRIADRNGQKISDIRGSWAGAMGHFQFIPTTLAQYGADGNGDGKIDIIGNVGDAVFSAGNYLSKLGWNMNERIIRKVVLPEDFDMSLCDGKTRKALAEWRAMKIEGVPGADMTAGLVCDATSGAGAREAYLAYPNFYRIKKWNNSNSYAIAAALLSEELGVGN